MKSEKFLKYLVGDWYGPLKPILISQEFSDLIDYLTTKYQKDPNSIVPPQKNVFRAFKECQFKDVRCVIYALDPYTKQGVANGLAFAHNLGHKPISPSLSKISESVTDDYDKYLGLPFDFDYTLESWAKQGVLLLNAALTTELNVTGAHLDRWRFFTQGVLKALSEWKPGTIYCLFGKEAQKFKEFIEPVNNYILEAEHPSYAARNGRRWDFSFKEVDKITKLLNGDKIQW